jgi:formylglycine-generating enzyme required for sulfatase activity
VLAKLGDPRLEVLTCEHMAFCHVPAGEFLYGEKKEKINLPDEFWMGKYPVTNAQYLQFVAAGGYAEARFWQEAIKAKYWTKAGFKGRYDDEPRTAPIDYGEPYTLSNHPVVGVSWYEAMAFARWLSEQLAIISAQWTVTDGEKAFREQIKAGKLQVTLPTEPQWEKAARSTDGRTYPWGDDADPNRANYDQTGINTPNAVGCFPGGKSLYGAQEMSGNVWEWTETAENASTLRGGAFHYPPDLARCAYRLRFLPDHRYHNHGFRVVVLSPLLLSLNSGL